jgi:hypothetical protein
MLHCIKWHHIFNSNTVPTSNKDTMKHNFSWCSTRNTILTCCVKQRSLRTSDWDVHSQDFIMPPNIGFQRHPHCPNCCKIFCLSSSVPTCRDCTVCQSSWCCMQAISLLVTPATIWSPVYPNLLGTLAWSYSWQILIWSNSVAVLPSFTWHGSRIRNPTPLSLSLTHPRTTHTQTHTLSLSLFCPMSRLFSIPPMPDSLPDNSVLVLVLHMSDPFWQ